MMVPSTGAAGRRVLVVEDEFFLARRMAGAFAELGVETIGPVGTVRRALDLVEHSDHLDGAVLDIKLRDGTVFPVADALRARGVPFVFTTGYTQHAIPDRYKGVARYEKPSDPAEVARALFRNAGRHSPYGADSAPAAPEGHLAIVLGDAHEPSEPGPIGGVGSLGQGAGVERVGGEQE